MLKKNNSTYSLNWPSWIKSSRGTHMFFFRSGALYFCCSLNFDHFLSGVRQRFFVGSYAGLIPWCVPTKSPKSRPACLYTCLINRFCGSHIVPARVRHMRYPSFFGHPFYLSKGASESLSDCLLFFLFYFISLKNTLTLPKLSNFRLVIAARTKSRFSGNAIRWGRSLVPFASVPIFSFNRIMLYTMSAGTDSWYATKPLFSYKRLRVYFAIRDNLVIRLFRSFSLFKKGQVMRLMRKDAISFRRIFHRDYFRLIPRLVIFALPLFIIRTVRRGREYYPVPTALDHFKRNTLAIQIFLRAIGMRTNAPFRKRFVLELISLLLSQQCSYSTFLDKQYEEVVSNRVYTHFRW